MTWCIAADSSCNFRAFEPKSAGVEFRLAPLKIQVAGKEYIDDASLDVDELLDAIDKEDVPSSSACPSAGEWAEIFRGYDNVVAVCIAAGMSASYDAACMARNIVMEEYMNEHPDETEGKHILIVDSHAAGGKLEVLVKLIDRYLSETKDFEVIQERVRSLEASSQVLFSLSSYDNLTKNGRMPKLMGTVATKLNIRMLGTASPEGTIKIVGPTRGEKKMIIKILDAMAADGYCGGMVHVNHVRNAEGAEALAQAIIERWPSADVSVLPCGGLCSYYAEESGLIIGYEWM